jgi:hypothetical protein
MTQTTQRWYTNAPECYDSFGTRTVRVIGQDGRGRDVREVEIASEHVEWHRGRYASGLYWCDATEEFARYVLDRGL